MTLISTPCTAAFPLAGVKIIEFAAIGPVPWGVNLLVDMGASVTRIGRLTRPCNSTQAHKIPSPKAPDAISERGRNTVYLDLKSEAGRAQALTLIAEHDVLIEGMRPGVMERLGLDPNTCHKHQAGLVYARVTGWGQQGPLAHRAGHDINYIALSGALHAIGAKNSAPCIPLNLVGDYGGGGAFMVMGVLSALIKARSTGLGSVIDIAMIDGAARQMGLAYERLGIGQWIDQRGTNLLDGGAPWYSVYQTQCGAYMAVGAIEPEFYKLFLLGLELDPNQLPNREDPDNWEPLRAIFAERFRSRTRAQWTDIFDPLDACVSPVLSLREAPLHPHNISRGLFTKTSNGAAQPGVAPRFTTLSTDH